MTEQIKVGGEEMKEARKLWVEALRSGGYQQGQGQLCKNDTYCCLGVACDLYAKRFPNALSISRSEAGVVFFGGHCSYLPPVVQQWLGLSKRSGRYEGGHIANLNDHYTSFIDIAGIIDSEPEGLFVK